MFKQAVTAQMEKWHIKNPNQLAKLAGIDYRTACKAVNTEEQVTNASMDKIAKTFGFKGWLAFRKYAMENHSE